MMTMLKTMVMTMIAMLMTMIAMVMTMMTITIVMMMMMLLMIIAIVMMIIICADYAVEPNYCGRKARSNVGAHHHRNPLKKRHNRQVVHM